MLYFSAREYISIVTSQYEQGFFPPILGQQFMYSRTVISVNYFNDGLARRGLGGTIASMLSADWTTSGILFFFVSVIWLVAPIALIIRQIGASFSWTTSLYGNYFCHFAANISRLVA